MTSAIEVYTIGHSTMPYAKFVELLRGAGITAVADVRSAPYSRQFPHFNREELREELRLDNIAYSFLGGELGGRPKDKSMFSHGVADYEKMASTESFEKGLARVLDGAKKFRVAMMCSEHNPLDCHRCLLVGRALHERGIEVKHVLSNGKIVNQGDIERELLALSRKTNGDFFESDDGRREDAYRLRAERVAYSEARDGVGKELTE